MEKLKSITPEQWEKVNPENRAILEDFLANSVELSPKSRKAYESNLRIWFVWVAENLNNKAEFNIKPLDYKRYQNWLMNRGVSSSDVNNKRAAISSLNNYIEIYYGDTYPTFRNFINRSIKRPPKKIVREKVPLTKEEWKSLIEELTRREEWQLIAYLQFTFETGCRREESRQLTKDSVDIIPVVKTKTTKDANGNDFEQEIKIYYTKPIRCKGAGEVGKIRRLAFGEEAMNALKKWVEVRGEDECPYMFISKYGGSVKQVNAATFNIWMRDIVSPIVGRSVHPHSIRATRATQAVVEDGKDVEAVRQLLGHEDQSTTLNFYVVKEDDDELDDLF